MYTNNMYVKHNYVYVYVHVHVSLRMMYTYVACERNEGIKIQMYSFLFEALKN